jgi:hypothetical protein
MKILDWFRKKVEPRVAIDLDEIPQSVYQMLKIGNKYAVYNTQKKTYMDEDGQYEWYGMDMCLKYCLMGQDRAIDILASCIEKEQCLKNIEVVWDGTKNSSI